METIDLDLDEIFDQRDDGELAEDIAAPIQPEGDGDDQAQEGYCQKPFFCNFHSIQVTLKPLLKRYNK